ncbi:MAG: hypothetical protein IKD43_01960 [Clostridia bacterium]|nr:hypothetical protein [Clostridia bacterium]
MYESSIPKTKAEQEQRGRVLALRCSVCTAGAFAFAVLAILALFGVVILAFIYQFGDAPEEVILAVLSGLAVGAVAFALIAFFLVHLSPSLEKRRNDFLERCDGEESFFVGEGTFATFEKDGLVFHGEETAKRIHIPYRQIRFLSVCTRKRARERGEWSVVFEVPAHYLIKDGKENDPPALIQTDGKERLYRVIERHNLQLLGEMPTSKEDVRFTPKKLFSLPDQSKRKSALITLSVGMVLLVLAVVLGILWEVAIGALLGVFGILFGVRGILSFVRARAVFGVYKEGIFWQEASRAESAFLKWEEIECIAAEQKDGLPLLAVKCAYGFYHFPRAEGAWECLIENFPEKCEG